MNITAVLSCMALAAATTVPTNGRFPEYKDPAEHPEDREETPKVLPSRRYSVIDSQRIEVYSGDYGKCWSYLQTNPGSGLTIVRNK